MAGVAILLLATTANVLTALLFQPLFDNGVIGKQTSVLVSVVALQMALFVARGALAGFAFDLFARASARLGQRLTFKVSMISKLIRIRILSITHSHVYCNFCATMCSFWS